MQVHQCRYFLLQFASDLKYFPIGSITVLGVTISFSRFVRNERMNTCACLILICVRTLNRTQMSEPEARKRKKWNGTHTKYI